MVETEVPTTSYYITLVSRARSCLHVLLPFTKSCTLVTSIINFCKSVLFPQSVLIDLIFTFFSTSSTIILTSSYLQNRYSKLVAVDLDSAGGLAYGESCSQVRALF